MAKIHVLVPNQELADYALQIIAEEKMDSCQVEVIRTSHAVQSARNAIGEGANVIVARGLQADFIREYTKVPLVNISMTGQEVGLLVEEAKQLTGKEHPVIAFVGHYTMFPDSSYMNEIFHAQLLFYTYEDRSRIETIVQKAVTEGTDVVIGGERVLKCMQQYPHIPSLFLRTREDSLRKALHVARRMVYTSQVEKENHAQFLTVLETVYNGVLKVDTEKNVTAANHAAAWILNRTEAAFIGRKLYEVMPQLEESYLERVLSGEREIITTTMLIGRESYMVSIAPIAYDGRITGAILSIHKIPTGSRKNQDLFEDNLLFGYLSMGDFCKIETKSERMKKCMELARTYALSSAPVIIYGETGTEKEVFAQGIHNNGYQKNSHYLTVNCSGMSEEQQIAALFGEGAQDKQRKAALEQAAFGTLLIRDIDELCLRCQYRLMRVMRYKVFMKTDIEEIPSIEVRIIATAREELAQKVRNGQFREDLYYLLNAFAIHLPPLRERREDIPGMVQNYFRQYNKKYSKRVSLTKGGMDALCGARWDGNALQLERFCERLVLTAHKRNMDEVCIRELLLELYPKIETHSGIQSVVVYEPPEKEEIEQALAQCKDNRQKTAELLGISTATLWRKMKKYGIE